MGDLNIDNAYISTNTIFIVTSDFDQLHVTKIRFEDTNLIGIRKCNARGAMY